MEPGDALAAAYGDDPALTLRCGVGRPAGLTRFSPLQGVSGVDWFVPVRQIEDPGADVVATTAGRQPAVEVVVPAQRRPPADALAALAQVVGDATVAVPRMSGR